MTASGDGAAASADSPPDGLTALRSAWRLLAREPERVVVPSAVLLVGGTALFVVVMGALDRLLLRRDGCAGGSISLARGCAASTGATWLLLLTALGCLLVVAQLAGAVLARLALDVVDGRASTFASVLRRSRPGAALLTALMLAVPVFAGTLLCMLPGVLLGLLGQFAMMFVVDGRRGPLRAIGASVVLTAGDGLLLAVVVLVVLLAGAALAGVGLVLAAPLCVLAQAVVYRAHEPAPGSPEARP